MCSPMNEIRIEADLLPKQKLFVEADNRYQVYTGAVRSGKTWGAIIKCCRKFIFPVKSRGAIGNQTVKQAKITTQYRFNMILNDIQSKIKKYKPNFQLYEYNATDRIYTFYNGSQVIFFSYDDATKVQGLDLDWFWMDEANTASESLWDMLPTRLSENAFNGKHYAIFTTNPSHFNHWIYRHLIENQNGLDVFVIHTTSWDNNKLPDATIADYKSKKNINKQVYDRLYEGKWGNLEGLVYDTFDSSIHLQDFDLSNYRYFFRTIDWGYTNPFCCLWIAVDGDENIYVFDEYYYSERLEKINAENIMKEYTDIKFDNTYVDPSARQFIEMLRNDYSISVTAANNEKIEGIMSVQEKLAINETTKKPKLFISPKCSNLQKEISSYVWVENKDGTLKKEEPIKYMDHALDSLRYFIHTYFDNRKMIRLNNDFNYY